MKTAKGFVAPWLALVVALWAPSALTGQSTAADHMAGRATDGHVHEGEIGELYLKLEHNLRCNCSCGLDVHMCQFRMSCDVSPVWSARIRESLEAGETPDAIEAGFVSDYGLKVLMAPPAEGFNLLGYLLPTVAIVTAGMLIGLIARGGTRHAATVPVRELTDADAEKLRDALRKLDEAESPDW